ncbi:MAG: hypothetical protein HKN87_02340 [Saprospiraceae bacterium]|nr:hypothetical protein [Saprospiraceae bacterium]
MRQPTSCSSAAKPQAKVWKYDQTFFAVFPDVTGTYIWQLEERQWHKHLLLSQKVNSQADCFAHMDTVFILLFQGEDSESAVVWYRQDKERYQFIDDANPTTDIQFHESTETATIALDGLVWLWVTYEANGNIEVRRSAPPYDQWSAPQTIASMVADDDISALVRMPNAVGVMWSNQRARQFGFRTHSDGDPMTTWTGTEFPGIDDALDVGHGLADDHINLKSLADGTIYAAVKTSFDTANHTKIGLLIRNPQGVWNDLYHVSHHGTRPMVTIDTLSQTLRVYYTHSESGGNIVYKASPLNNISFGAEQMFMEGSMNNNVTSTNFAYSCENVVLASDKKDIISKQIRCSYH